MFEVKNISVHSGPESGQRIKSIKEISFSFEEKKITAVFSGYNSETTLLFKVLSGLTKKDSGDINFDNKSVYIPCEPSSFPWLTVKENIEFEVIKPEMDIKKVIDLIGLDGYENFYPDNNSYGFRFRISLGRALIRKPDVIIIDNILRSLDRITKLEIIELLKDLNEKIGITILISLDNLEQAKILSDQVIDLSIIE